MPKTAGHILKSTEVKLEGQVRLDVRHPETSQQQGKIAGPVTPQARIVQSRPEFAVIEVVCSCGAKTLLRCEYADGTNLSNQ